MMMSRGFGRIQREIAALLESEPWGAWTTTELCQRIYRIQNIEKRHRVAVTRALRGQVYPITGWGSMRGDHGESIVCNQYHTERPAGVLESEVPPHGFRGVPKVRSCEADRRHCSLAPPR